MNALYTAAIAALTLLIGGAGGYTLGHHTASAQADAAMNAHLAADAQAAAAAEQAVHYREHELALAANAASESYEQGKRDAQKSMQKTVDDLSAGALQLRQRWAGCESNRVSNAAASARELDALTADRSDSAGRIVRAAAECDAQVTALQKMLVDERQ